MRADLHVHTRESGSPPEHWLGALLGVRECYTHPEEAVAEAGRKGLDAVAITNHDSAADALALARAHPEKVIPGCEYTVYGGRGRYAHVVVLGIDERRHGRLLEERVRGLARLAEYARAERMPFFLAHPAWEVGPERKGVDPALLCEWLEHFDVIETLNFNCPAESDVAGSLAAYFGKGRTGGSDAHNAASIGRAWTEAEARSLPEFLDRLREGRVRAGGAAGDAGSFTASVREVLGAFYRRELLRAAGAGSLEKYLSRVSPSGALRALGEAVLLPGFLWAPEAQAKAYLDDLSRRAEVLGRKLLDHLALRVSRSVALEDAPPEERARRWAEGMTALFSAFARSGKRAC